MNAKRLEKALRNFSNYQGDNLIEELQKEGYKPEEVPQIIEALKNAENVTNELPAKEEKNKQAKVKISSLVGDAWEKYQEDKLKSVAYKMKRHIVARVTKKVEMKFDKNLNKQMVIVGVELVPGAKASESVISPMMAETLNSQLFNSGSAGMYYSFDADLVEV